MADRPILLGSPDIESDAFEAIPHDVALLGPGGRLERVNQRWLRSGADPLVDLQPGQDFISHLATLAEPVVAIAEHIAEGVQRVIDGRSPRFELQYQIAGPDGARWFLLAAGARSDGGAVLTHTDTTVHHRVQDVLTEMAFHDGLTGLPNRILVVDRLRMALTRSRRNRTSPAIIFIDLDGFKSVNDTYGHSTGDLVLKEVADRLSSVVREGDTCGRWGGDEFVLLIDLSDPSPINGLIVRTQAAFAEPLRVDGHSIAIRLSMGVVVSQPGDSVDDLVRRADRAMYEAKRSPATEVSIVMGPATD